MKIAELRAHADELGFTPMDAVRWLSPGQLVRTGVKVALSQVFANYDDKRELQATFASTLLRVPAEPGRDMWFDFAADLGDGFDATYTVAWLLGREMLDVAAAPTDASRGEQRLPRGSLLVLGGDEVYPAASPKSYDNRTKGPYRAASPSTGDEPQLVALPGNHDWYDGLTSFLRVFTQGRPIGGWRTAQTRSYFAVQLPARWWLLGLDTQLGSYLDGPQLDYFTEHVTRHLRPGDGVIICAASPAWVHTAGDDTDAFDTLHWFERNYVTSRRDPATGEQRPTGAEVRLWLTGDKHHYARYAERLPDDDHAADRPLTPDRRRRQMITCGLGGAYLRATHTLPADLLLPPQPADPRDTGNPPMAFARAQVTCPDTRTSRAWSRRLALPWSRFWLPRRNPGFAQLAAGLQVALFLVAAFFFGLTRAQPPVQAVRSANLPTVGVFDVEALVAVAVVLLLPWAFGLVRTRRWSPPSTVVLAVLLQVCVALAALTAAVAVPWPGGWADWLVLAFCAAGAAVVGAGLGSEAFALYILSARSGDVAHLQMAGQAVEDVKGFLRVRIADDGDLTVYPLVVPEVCHDWALADDPASGRARPVPATAPDVTLIEDPVVIARDRPETD